MRAKACAKAILLGEHAVVHGVPAIAVPIAARGTEVELVESDALRDVEVEDARGLDGALAARMARLALDMTETPPRGAKVKIRSTIPHGSGLGSSAALAVALVRACRGGSALEPAEVARRANELEKLAHGTPSGIDAAVVAWERPIVFEKGKEPVPLAVGGPLKLAAGVLPRTGTTASLVAGVRRLSEGDPARFAAVLGEIRSAVEITLEAIRANKRFSETFEDGVLDPSHSVRAIGMGMFLNRHALQDLGVSTPAVEAACDAAIQAGALAAKLSGAGGGGAVIALLGPESDPDRVLAALRGAGALDAFVTEVPACAP